MYQVEIDYWCNEFPTLDREEIIDLLEAVNLDIQRENNNEQTTLPNE